jgi:hypothetical protein
MATLTTGELLSLLASFVSPLLSPFWESITVAMVGTMFLVWKLRFTWTSALLISLPAAATLFIPQLLRPVSVNVATQPAQPSATPYPLFTMQGDDRHDTFKYNFVCGSPGEWRSEGSRSSLDAEGNTVMGSCPPEATRR